MTDSKIDMDNFFLGDADPQAIAREKAKARDLRKSPWWKNKLAAGICHYCRKQFAPGELTMDHVVPLARGGVTRKSNVVAACKECNSKKKYLLPIEWEEYVEYMGRG